MKAFRPLHRVLVLALVACASLALPAIASAQALYGSLTGTVTDNTGAAIPGVTVTVANEGTGLKLDTVTDGEGLYTVRNVAARHVHAERGAAGIQDLHANRYSADAPATSCASMPRSRSVTSPSRSR